MPTVRLRVLFVFIVLEHQRRKVLHFGVTEHPTAEWVAQQLAESFAERDAPRYLIRDRDPSYGDEFRRRIQSLGIKELISYFSYYHQSRTHLALAKDAPESRTVMHQGTIISIPSSGWAAPSLRTAGGVRAKEG